MISVVYFNSFCQHIIAVDSEVNGSMKNEPLKIKKRGEDGSRVITVRMREDIIEQLDRLAAETNYSRNELINLILRHGVNNIEIE